MNLIIEQFNSPIELLNALYPIEYGAWDPKNNRIVYDTEDDFRELLPILKPEEVWKYKVGTCWETSILIYLQLLNMPSIVKDVKYIWFDNDKTANEYESIETHTTCIFQSVNSNNNLYWFEYSWNKFRGIHGPFHNYSKLLNDISNGLGYKFRNDKVDVNKLLALDTIMPMDMIKICRGDI